MSSLELKPFRRLIDEVIPRARPHVRRLFPWIAAPMAAAGAGTVLAQRKAISALSPIMDPSAGDPLAGFGVFVLFMALTVGMSFLFALSYAALTLATHEALEARPVDPVAAWASALRPRVLWTLLVVAMVNGVAFLLCVFPIFAALPLTALALQVVAAEKVYGFQAIQRSFSLAWWNGDRRFGDSPFFRVLGMLFIGWILQSAAGLLVQGPFLAAQQYFILRDAAGGVADPLAQGPLWIQLSGQVLASLATSLCWFYWTFGLGMLYRELRRSREAEDLRSAVAELTEPAGSLPSPGTA
ncbi:MAG: hypothetical protein AAF725_10660 [Acidobacteriota bacterium]